MTSLLLRKQDTGSMPPPNALPKIKPSGRINECSKANIFPVLPSPDWTSSRIRSTLFSVQSSRTFGNQDGSGIIIPASPCMGSTSTAAVFSVIADRSESMQPNFTVLNPGVRGPKFSLDSLSDEKLMIVVVLP